MEDIIFAINAVLPIILMIMVGYILKKIGLLEEENAKKLSTLVFRIFLPVMLFLNVYKIEDFGAIAELPVRVTAKCSVCITCSSILSAFTGRKVPSPTWSITGTISTPISLIFCISSGVK